LETVSQIELPATTGEDHPRPGRDVRQRTFSRSFQRSGMRLVAGAREEPRGPRNSGQSVEAPDGKSADSGLPMVSSPAKTMTAAPCCRLVLVINPPGPFLLPFSVCTGSGVDPVSGFSQRVGSETDGRMRIPFGRNGQAEWTLRSAESENRQWDVAAIVPVCDGAVKQGENPAFRQQVDHAKASR